MASVIFSVCPVCFQERELIDCKLGVLKFTMCPYCLERFLTKSLIPRIEKSHEKSKDTIPNILFGVATDDE